MQNLQLIYYQTTMFEYADIEQQYASYAALKENNCIGMTCLSAKQLENYMLGVRGHKTQSVYSPIKAQDLHETLEEEDQYYHRWKQHFSQSLQDERKDPLQHSIFKTFRTDIWFGIILAQIGYICHCMTPLLLFYIYGNLVQSRVHSTDNKILVLAVILCRVLRTFGCYYGEIQQNKAGLKMYRLVTNAILKKTILCSPLTNKNISSTDLSKMMHTDCSVLLMYPAKLSYFLENVLSFITLSAIVLFVSGLPGLIGILLIGANLFFRILFKKVINKVEKGLNERTKQRVKATIQIFNIIKFIKANALESCYFNKLRQLRINEVMELKTRLFLQIIQNIIIMISKPLIVVLVVKLLAERGQTLNLQVLFTVNLCIIIINMQAIINALAYIDIIQISLKNIQEFMQQDEMDLSHIHFSKDIGAKFAIQIDHGNFKWDSKQKQQQPILDNELHLKDINLKIKKGELVTLIGTYGSGKTSLANCLLGEMKRKGNPSIEINGSIAYASQVPWIMNDTIRNNILFGKPYNYKKYAEVIKYASLESDLLLFPNGDLQIIGKRGSTLSGGQRARVSLARALYSDADIYILDDILSAVDAHVGSFIFSMTIKRYLKSKTVLLITHSLYYVSYADRIIIFEDGEIKSEGTYDEVGKSPYLRKITASQLRTSKDYDMVLSKTLDFAQPQHVVRRTQEEEQTVGIFESFKTYIKRNSGTLFAVIMIIFILVLSAVTTNTQINLNKWALSAESRNNSYLYIQLLLNGCKVVITLVLAWVLHRSRLFQSIHDDMIRSLLFSPLSYFQKVPSQKIINRLSNDLSINDKIITTQFAFLLTNIQMFLAHLLGIFYVYIIFSNYFYLAFLILTISITLYILETYFTLSLKINKLEQQLIIPINTKYSELLDGLTVIRAFKKMQYILDNFWNKMNIFSMSSVIRHIVDGRIKFIIYVSTNFLAVIDILSLLFFDSTFKNYTVFVIFNYFAFEDTIMRFYQSLSAFAPRLESLGKCQQLTVLEPERGYANFLDKNWSEDRSFEKVYFGTQIFPRGEIVFKSFCLRYKPDSEDVLKHLSLTIQPGEKIGIVGRTGSGKSTMMLGLLRILEASSGCIEIDGKDISQLSLEELRSNINIILQDHFMFAGTVRENVDPTGSHTDQQVEEVLRLCGIWDQFSSKEGVNTLVAEGGDNLSSGEKQLLNISRSLLNPKRIVLIDEATASIDIETDALIQKVIKKQFADKTVLTIAHRINTVVQSDRILVLNKGEIAEFDSPERLLERQNSVFAKLYKQSGKMKEEEGNI